MAEFTVNGRLCIRGEISENETGPWFARVHVDDEDNDISGNVEISSGTALWSGTIVPEKGSVEAGRYIAEIVGGKNGLQAVLPAKYYYRATLATIIADIMSECGETFDAAESDSSIASYQVPRWLRARGEARIALQAVANELGGYWRINRAGNVVVLKDDSWKATDEPYTEISRDPSKCIVVITPDEEPFARPGVSVGGERIVTVRTTWDGRKMQQVLQVHDGTDKAQDPGNAMADLARRANELATVYGRWYPAKVVAQDADGTLHLLPDSEVVRGNGLTAVPMRHGIPGLTVKVALGEYVRLFFEDGDPKKPAAALWPDGSSVLEVSLDAQAQASIAAPMIRLGTAPTQSFVKGEEFLAALTAWRTALDVALTAALGPVDLTGAIASAYNSAAATAFAQMQAALSQAIKGQ